MDVAVNSSVANKSSLPSANPDLVRSAKQRPPEALAQQPENTRVANKSSLSSANPDLVRPAKQGPPEALKQQTESTRVRLSAAGQVKSALAGLQTAATGLQDPAQIRTAADAKKAAVDFVDAFNAEKRTTANLTRREDSRNQAGALADDPRIRSVSSSLQRVVNNTQSELQSVGITLQKNGTLSIDTKAFETAYVADPSSATQSLSTLGSRVEAVATRQLSASGAVGSTVNSLRSKVANLEDRQLDVQARLDESQRIVREQAERFTAGPFATGVSAYKGIFSI